MIRPQLILEGNTRIDEVVFSGDELEAAARTIRSGGEDDYFIRISLLPRSFDLESYRPVSAA